MTVVVGLVAPGGDIFMGGDSAGTTQGGSQSVYINKKVFSPVYGPAFVMGVCGTHRLSQVLRYSFVPPQPPGEGVDLEEFMARDFVNAVRACYDENGILTNDSDGAETGSAGSFLIGYQGRLFRMEENFQILIDRRPYMAIGSGEDCALGAMFATESVDADPIARITTAIKAAVAFTATCREPYDILKLPFDPTWGKKSQRRKRSAKGKG